MKGQNSKTVVYREDIPTSIKRTWHATCDITRLLGKLEKYASHLYGHVDCTDVNKARYNLFRLGKHSEDLLPPTKDSLRKHVMRAKYQAAEWRRILE